MKSTLNTWVAALVLAALSASAAHSRPFEDSHELDASQVTMPSTSDGTVVVQGCSTCPRTQYTLSSATRFYLAKREVTFAEFKRHLDAKREAPVFLVHTHKLNVVTRLVAQ
jgi:hypothetical protein